MSNTHTPHSYDAVSSCLGASARWWQARVSALLCGSVWWRPLHSCSWPCAGPTWLLDLPMSWLVQVWGGRHHHFRHRYSLKDREKQNYFFRFCHWRQKYRKVNHDYSGIVRKNGEEKYILSHPQKSMATRPCMVMTPFYILRSYISAKIIHTLRKDISKGIYSYILRFINFVGGRFQRHLKHSQIWDNLATYIVHFL